MKNYKVIKCENCGEKLALVNPLTNLCKCGTAYNGFGEELAPMEEWGYDTDEYYHDLF